MVDRIKEHFKSWDERELGVRTRSGSGGHRPDDLAMAAWIGFVKCLEILEGSQNNGIQRKMPVPPSVQRRWDRMQKMVKAKHNESEHLPRVTATNKEIVTMMLGGQDVDNHP